MVEIAKLLKFETKFIDINANSGVIDFDLIKNNKRKTSQYSLQICSIV